MIDGKNSSYRIDQSNHNNMKKAQNLRTRSKHMQPEPTPENAHKPSHVFSHSFCFASVTLSPSVP